MGLGWRVLRKKWEFRVSERMGPKLVEIGTGSGDGNGHGGGYFRTGEGDTSTEEELIYRRREGPSELEGTRNSKTKVGSGPSSGPSLLPRG